jgi:glucan-binding YG repeat protein
VNVDGQYYYADKGGKLATGRIWVGTYPSHGMIPKGYYEFGANGAMLNGVVAKEDGTYYYENGQTVDTGWLKVGNDYYVFTNGGKAMTGLNWVGSYLTETSRDPYMKGNFYFTADGKLANGVAQKDDGWYYFAAGVATKEGLVNLDGSYYLAEDGGKLATGRVWVGTYASNGLLPKGYYEFGADGKMLQGVAEKEDGLYYYDLGNTQYLGLIERDGEFYYVNEGGKLETGRVWVGSYASNGLVTKGYYEFGADGAMLNGFETLADGIYYYNMGVAQRIGLKVIDGDLYYITDGGKVVTGTVWVGTYDSNGLLPKGTYTFAEDGKFVG